LDLSNLLNKFMPEDIEWRIGRAGQKGGKPWALALAYVTNRAIQARLDEVCSPLNWQNEYKEWQGNSQICGISIYDNEKKEWVTKWDGADATKIDATKGGLSGSMKRAAVQWGIGRYLYQLPETYVKCSLEIKRFEGWKYQAKNDKKSIPAFMWEIPTLPKWAITN
jgi:hypothetical protein